MKICVKTLIRFAAIALCTIYSTEALSKVCFIIGECEEEEEIATHTNCVAEGYTKTCSGNLSGVGDACYVDGIAHYKSCECDIDKFPYKASDIDLPYKGVQTCTDSRGTHYAYRVCSGYPYVNNANEAKKLITKQGVVETFHACPDPNSFIDLATRCAEIEDRALSANVQRSSGCVCDEDKYPFRVRNILEADLNDYNRNIAGIDREVSYVYNGSGNKCTDTYGGEFYDDYTCPMGFQKENTCKKTYAMFKDPEKGVACYKCTAADCSNSGGLNEEQKNNELKTSRALLYNYKTDTELSINKNKVTETCYYRIPKKCSEMTYTVTKMKGTSLVSEKHHYSDTPIAGQRVSTDKISFPDAYTKAGAPTSRYCYKITENCEAGDVRTAKGYCLPKDGSVSGTSTLWGISNISELRNDEIDY